MKTLLLVCAVSAWAQAPVEVARSTTFTEGPVFDKDGNLYFSDLKGVVKVSVTGERTEWQTDPAAGFNGHKILADGTHIVCASKKSAIWRYDMAGKFLGAAATECDGKPLRAPNDIALDGRGGYYFSDPGGSREAPIGTVHYVTAGGRVLLSTGGLRVPNGLAVDAASVPFLSVLTLTRAFQRRFPAHRRIARYAFPIWLYVSCTGVIVYWMLYRM